MLRLERTKRSRIERGVGKKVDIPKYLTQKELAKKLCISQQTVAKAESGDEPSLNTIRAYHDYFKVPYNTLLGESSSLVEQNVKINQELGLSDECISTIKNMSYKSLTMLNAFMSLNSETNNFFSYMADFLTERDIQKTNKASIYELSIKASLMKDFYLQYLECIPHKELENVYRLTEDEKALEYEIPDDDSLKTIYEYQDEMAQIECKPIKIEVKLIDDTPKEE